MAEIEPNKTLEELFRFRLAQLRSDSEYATSTISQITRVASYGLMALAIPFVTTAFSARAPVLVNNPWLVVAAAACGLVAASADILQNHFADVIARRELSRLAENLKQNLKISSPGQFMSSAQPSFATAARQAFYWLKIVAAVAGVITIIAAIADELASS
jgi:hypothetical protein